ncbi:MAG: anaerobic ribonucleoside-triphosphate reductase activating protein [Christensenellales bacterium]
MGKLRIAGVENDSITDGPGLRFVVFTQGCPHNCKGCHNPQTHSLNGGTEIDCEELLKMIDNNPLLSGVTISGGEPILQAKALIPFADAVKQRKLNLALYTGFTYEQLMEKNDSDILQLLKYVDVIIDGKFEIEKKSFDLKFKGSSNQRIIDMQKSLNEKKVVLMENSSWN